MSLNRAIAIHGVPRSGTSWLGEIFKSAPQVAYRYQPLFSYAFKGRLTPTSTPAEIEAFCQELWRTDDAFVLQRDPAIHPDHGQGHPLEQATHLVYKEVRYHHVVENLLERSPITALVAIIRDPRAVIDSWCRAPKEFDPAWDLMSEWRAAARKNQSRPEEFYGYDRWKEAAGIFHRLRQRHPDRVNLVRYAELNAEPVRVARGLFAARGLEWTEHTEHFIAQSRSREGGDAYSVYRTPRPDDAWRGRLPVSIAQAIADDLRGTALEYLLDDAT